MDIIFPIVIIRVSFSTKNNEHPKTFPVCRIANQSSRRMNHRHQPAVDPPPKNDPVVSSSASSESSSPPVIEKKYHRKKPWPPVGLSDNGVFLLEDYIIPAEIVDNVDLMKMEFRSVDNNEPAFFIHYALDMEIHTALGLTGSPVPPGSAWNNSNLYCIVIPTNANIIYWYCWRRQYNILVLLATPIQYICIAGNANTIYWYCCRRTIQYIVQYIGVF
jgi:hypothetical protein